MRINIKTSPNTSIVPYDHLKVLVGTIHKWIGAENDLHGHLAMHSFSWLQGARKGNGGLLFERGASFFISAYDEALIKKIMNGVLDEPEMFCGMKVNEIKLQYTPLFEEEQQYFSVASPVLIKRKIGERVKHCLFSDPEANESLTQSMRKKMERSGVNASGMSIAFDKEYTAAHSKLVNYRGVMNKASVCPVLVSGNQEQIGFIWDVGVGNSTGIGFGALN